MRESAANKSWTFLTVFLLLVVLYFVTPIGVWAKTKTDDSLPPISAELAGRLARSPKIFVSYTGVSFIWLMGDAGFSFTSLVYNLRQSKDCTVVSDPTHADLVFEISGDENMYEGQITDSHIHLRVYDPKTNTDLCMGIASMQPPGFFTSSVYVHYSETFTRLLAPLRPGIGTVSVHKDQLPSLYPAAFRTMHTVYLSHPDPIDIEHPLADGQAAAYLYQALLNSTSFVVTDDVDKADVILSPKQVVTNDLRDPRYNIQFSQQVVLEILDTHTLRPPHSRTVIWTFASRIERTLTTASVVAQERNAATSLVKALEVFKVKANSLPAW